MNCKSSAPLPRFNASECDQQSKPTQSRGGPIDIRQQRKGRILAVCARLLSLRQFFEDLRYRSPRCQGAQLGNMRLLGYWLCLVGFARLSSIFFGYFKIWALQTAVYSKQKMTDIHGRTFAAWTAVTCVLCFLTAVNLDSEPLYQATMASFLIAGGHFAIEYLVYKSMTLKNFSTVGFFAGVSFAWMLLEYPNPPQLA